MNEFGALLRSFRMKCKDPETGRILSQQRFGGLLREAFGVGFSGAAVSDWERGNSKIHVDDRLLLTCLIMVLHECGGIQSPTEANELLEAGNYRALNLIEIQRVFKDRSSVLQVPTLEPDLDIQRSEFRPWEVILFGANQDLKNLFMKAQEGPPPVWPRVIVALLRGLTDRLSASGFLRVLFFIWIWVLAYFLITPSLGWPFIDSLNRTRAVVQYIAGALIVPPLIGLLAKTKDNKFWKDNGLSSSPVLRLYIHQGAFIGFHIGYFAVFLIDLIRYSLDFLTLSSFGWAGTLAVLMMGYIGANVIPYNLWRAFGRLNLKDGYVFFVFILMGPIWGFFLFQYFPLLLSPTGLFIVMTIVTLMSGMTAWQTSRKKSSIG